MAERKVCRCPICVSNEALAILRDPASGAAVEAAISDLSAALDVFVEYGEEDQMDLSYLRDEVEDSLALPWWRPIEARRALREALRVVRRPARPWMNWKADDRPPTDLTVRPRPAHTLSPVLQEETETDG